MLQRYNLAACPIEYHDNDRFYKIASNFDALSNGYCLQRDHALPHVTLCQFRTADNQNAIDLAREYLSINVEVSVSEIYIKPYLQTDAYWIGFTVQRAEPLMKLQSKIVDQFLAKSVETLVGVGNDYFPHFTVARIFAAGSPLNQLLSDKPLLSRTIPCCLRLGLSDENGQFTRVLA